MGDWLLAALITAALLVLAAWMLRGLIRYGDRLDGKGNASQASGSLCQDAVCFHGVPILDDCLQCAARWPR